MNTSFAVSLCFVRFVSLEFCFASFGYCFASLALCFVVSFYVIEPLFGSRGGVCSVLEIFPGNSFIYITAFDLITAHTPISAQSSNCVIFQITASVPCVYFVIKAYFVGNILNFIDSSMQFK